MKRIYIRNFLLFPERPRRDVIKPKWLNDYVQYDSEDDSDKDPDYVSQLDFCYNIVANPPKTYAEALSRPDAGFKMERGDDSRNGVTKI